MVGNSGSDEIVALTPQDGPALGDRFDLLANRRRRVTLGLLAERDGPVAMADLAEAVAVRENGSSAVESGDQAVRDAYISLYHWHVPKLAEAGVVEFDPGRNSVAVSDGEEWVDGVGSLVTDGGR